MDLVATLQKGDLAAANELVSSVIADSQNFVTARQWFDDVLGESRYGGSQSARKGLLEKITDKSVKKRFLQFVLEQLEPRAVSFEEQISVAKEVLAGVLETEEDWAGAAKLLSSIPLESSYRNVSALYKANVYIHIVRLLLEEEDSVQAEAYLHRASAIIADITDNTLLLSYKVCQVRILDYKRKFLEAAQRYYELSLLVIDPEEKNHCLRESVKSALLAKAGPSRTRVLTMLFKDDRVSRVCSPKVFKMLENVLMNRLLKGDIVQEFSKTLSPHQLATLGDGSTVLDLAVWEHNLLASSKIYRSVSIKRLASLVGISADKAEKMLVVMINEGRLAATIKQAKGFVVFKKDALYELRNRAIYNVCLRIEACQDLISSS